MEQIAPFEAEFHLGQVLDILQGKLTKRGIDIDCLELGDVDLCRVFEGEPGLAARDAISAPVTTYGGIARLQHGSRAFRGVQRALHLCLALALALSLRPRHVRVFRLRDWLVSANQAWFHVRVQLLGERAERLAPPAARCTQEECGPPQTLVSRSKRFGAVFDCE